MRAILFFLFFITSISWSQSNFEKAERLFKEEKKELAKPIFEAYLKENPNHLKTIEYLGDIAGNNKDWDTAMLYYQKLKQLQPNEAIFYYKYGGAIGLKAKESNKLKAIGMLDEIQFNFEKAIALNPKHIEARWALIEFYLQLPAFLGGSEAKAKRYAAELMPISVVDGYLSKGRIEEYFKRYKEAEICYKKAFEIGKSKNCFQRLYNLYLNKMKDAKKAQELKEQM